MSADLEAGQDTRPRPAVSDGVVMALSQVALGLGVILVWQGASGRLIDNFFISNPVDVAIRLWRWTADGSIFAHIGATVYATAMGFIIGSVGGAMLGVWLGVSPFASRLLNPYLNALNAAQGRARAAVRSLVRARHRVEDRACRRAGAVSRVP